MLRLTLWSFVGVFVWGFASCTITCPDGNVCSDLTTCCLTKQGYRCCPYPNAVCCSDLAHCCPSGFRCNLVTQMCEKEDQPWMNMRMVKKEAAEEPRSSARPLSPLQEPENNHAQDQQNSSVVHCDSYYVCPDGTTCCRHPKGAWFCCPYSPGRCCLDGYHCCPYGYDCDYTYTHCVRQGLRYPFTPRQAPSSFPASPSSTSGDRRRLKEAPFTARTEARSGTRKDGVIRCDSTFFCSEGSTCCKGSKGQWTCCPYPLGQCCADERHCCQYGYTCDPSSASCRGWYSQRRSSETRRGRARTDRGHFV